MSPVDVVAISRANVQVDHDGGTDGQGQACAQLTQEQRVSLEAARGLVADHGLCVCEDFVPAGPVTVLGADVGVNGQLSLSSRMETQGLTVAAMNGIVLGGGAVMMVDALRSAGPLVGSSGQVYVASDAVIASRVQLDVFDVGGTLTIPSNAAIEVAQGLAAGVVRNAAVAVDAPCSCALDAGSNFAVTDLASLPALGSGASPNNTCSLVRLDPMATQGSQLSLADSQVVVVAGDLSWDGALDVNVENNAAATVIVLGNVRIGETLTLGSDSGRVDLFVQGGGTIELAGGMLRGDLIAPRAELVVRGPLTVSGHMMVRRAATSYELTIASP